MHKNKLKKLRKYFKSSRTLKSTEVSTTAGLQGLASSEQTRRVIDARGRGSGSWKS